MKIEIKKKVGDSEFVFQVEEDKDIDALFAAGTVASTPTKCGICGSENVQLEGNKAKGYTFVKVVCKDNACSARSQLGQYKDGGFYWKAWEKFSPQEQSGQENMPPAEMEYSTGGPGPAV